MTAFIMSPEEENNVQAMLKKEKQNRVVMPVPYELYECLAETIKSFSGGYPRQDQSKVKEQVKEFTDPKNIQQTVVEFLRAHSGPIENVLPFLDEHAPEQSDEMDQKAYKKLIELYFKNIISKCRTGPKYNDYLKLCLFAAATSLNVQIYILSINEADHLQWHFFKPWQHKGQRKNVLPYLTMYMSPSKKFFRIESRDWTAHPPKAQGLVGMYKQILKDTPTQEIDVPQELLELCTEDRTTLDDEVSRDVIEECCKLLLMQGFLQRDEYEKMTCHRARRDRFCQLVSRDENAYRCLCQVLIRRREKTLLSKYVNKWETFVKSSNYLAQIDAVIALDAAIYKRNISVSALIESCQNGSQEIDGRRKKVTTTVIAGSAVSIASSVMIIVGIALAPVSFGASLGLSITGGIIEFGSGATVGTARAIEGVKQNTKLNEIRTIFDLMQERENEVKTALSKAQDCFNLSFQGGQDNGQKYPGKSLRGFLAVGSAFRASHSVIGIILTSARLSASAAAVSASILGPLSLVFDLAFLAEATNNKVKGDRTNAGELLQEKAESANLKCNIFNSLLRGSHGEEKRLIDWNEL